MTDSIPLHDFSKDDNTSIPFKIIPIETKSHYDTTVPHRHNYYEIFIFVHGNGIHKIDFETHKIHSNSIHFVSPGQVHQVISSLDTHGYVILFSRDFYLTSATDKDALFHLPFLNNYGGVPVLNLEKQDMQVILQLSSLIEREIKQELSLYQSDIIRSCIAMLLYQSARFHVLSKSQTHETPSPEVYRKFRMLLEKNFRVRHKVKEYASLLTIPEKTLNREIKTHTGKTASEHIFDRILLEAKRLLQHTDRSTKEIGYFLGFDDPSHFSKFFKKMTGLSAGNFRVKI